MKENWTYKKLGEVGTFLRGKSIQKADFVEKGLPCIHYGQIHTKFGVSTNKHLSEIPEAVYNKSIIAAPGDIVIAITSEDLDGSCKSTAWLGDYNVAVSAHAAVYKHSINPKYVAYYLRSNTFYSEKQKYARGFKVMEIKTTDIAKIPIPIPSTQTQEHIVAELDEINNLLQLKKKELETFDKLAQSIFYEMFGDPVTNEKGWEVKKLGEVCEITSSKRIFADDYVESGVPFYRSKEVIEKSKKQPISVALFISVKKYEEVKTKYGIPLMGDILITAVGTIGKIWTIDTDEPFYFKDGNLVWLRNINRTKVEKAYFNNSLNILIEDYKKTNANGAAYNALTIVKLKEMSTPLPPLSLQQTFATRIEAIEQQKEQAKASVNKLETLLASRMQYWFD